MMTTIKEALNSEDVTFDKFYNALQEKEIGYWDDINSEDIMYGYIKDMMDREVHVNHVLKAIETNYSEQDLYKMDLGNSMNTPEPIDTKEDLIDALGLDEDDLKQEINID